MFKLVVDTSIQGGFLGLAEANSKVPGWIRSIKESRSSSMQLASMLKEGTDYYNCSTKDISTIFVSTGPGSFTGIKIGLAFCYGLVRAIPGVSLIGLSSFELLYQKLQSIYEDTVLVVGSTKTQGFVDIDGKVSNFNLTRTEDVSRLQEKIETSSTSVVGIGTWKEFESKFSKVHVLKMDITALHHMIYEAFCKYPLPDKLSGSASSLLPTPTYCREPSMFGN